MTVGFDYLRGRGWLPLASVAGLSAGAGAFLPTVLLHRRELMIDLDVSSAGYERLVAALLLLGGLGAACAGMAATARAARVLLQVSGLLAAAVFALLAAVNEITPLRALLCGGAVVCGPIWALARSVALDVYGPAGGWRAVAVPWAGAAAGATMVGVYELAFDYVNWGYVFGAAAAVLFVSAMLVPPARVTAVPAVPPRPVRPVAAAPLGVLAATLGCAAFGASVVAMELLRTKWALNTGGRGAVLAAAAGAACAFALFGHWFHGLAGRPPRHLVGVAEVAALAAALLIAAGAASPTYVGIVFCWMGAAVALVLSVIAAETAILPARTARGGHRVAGQLALAAAAGGAAGVAGLQLLDDLSRGWLVALAALPAAVVAAAAQSATPRHARVPAIAAPPPATSPGRPRSRGHLLECRGLEVAYDRVQVLFDVDVTVDEGQIVALLGTNGAGKTTLLRTISGLLSQREGTIHFGGVDVSRFDPTWRVALGMVQIAGGSAVAEGLTVEENLRMAGFSVGADRRRLRAGIDRALGVFPRLAERRQQPASTLSGGEKQMLALSKALILEPRLLIIDEFSLGLAPIVVGELLPIVQQVNAAGTAVLIVEQSVNIALSMADHAYCMEKGEIVYDGPAARLRDDPDLMRAVYLEGVGKALAG